MHSSRFLFSFITFPQILYDGFQAESANITNANESLPSFEFVDILTADVSTTTSFLASFRFSFDFRKNTSQFLLHPKKKKKKIVKWLDKRFHCGQQIM